MTQKTFASLLDSLDSDQCRAATCLQGPVRITAVAGAGKTRTITTRIAYACETGAWNPKTTVAVTFSTKAALEMRHRLQQLGITEVTSATFHSLAFSQLYRLWNELVGTEMPQLLENPLDLIYQAAKQVIHHDIASYDAVSIAEEINWTKVNLISPDDYGKVCTVLKRPIPLGMTDKHMECIIDAYEQIKLSHHQIDFQDVLLLLCHLLESSHEAAAMIQKTIQHLTIDEYQDISPLQHHLVQLWLGQHNKNICVVGDPAQTIYSFTGATNWYLKNFNTEFSPLSADIYLAKDYRSSQNIINLANYILDQSPVSENYVHLIAASSSSYAIPTIQTYRTDTLEADGIAHHIQQLLHSGISPNEIAVLTRLNAQLHQFRRCFDQSDIPFTVRRDHADDGNKFFFSQAIRKRIQDGTIGSLNTPTVTLSTIHAAKGMEWDHVFICGVSDDMIPFHHGNMKSEEIEEERRLLYIAVTGGKQQVQLSYAQQKNNNSSGVRMLSRFLQ